MIKIKNWKKIKTQTVEILSSDIKSCKNCPDSEYIVWDGELCFLFEGRMTDANLVSHKMQQVMGCVNNISMREAWDLTTKEMIDEILDELKPVI